MYFKTMTYRPVLSLFLCLIAFALTSVSRAASTHIAFIIAEDEYRAGESLPAFAEKYLRKDKGFKTSFLLQAPDDKYKVLGLEALATADLVVMYVRRRSLPPQDMKRLRDFLAQGKPLLALRTSSHAWDTRNKGPQTNQEWKTFDAEVLGGNYHGHHGNSIESSISVVPGMEAHPVLKDVDALSLVGKGSLYKASPLAKGAQVILVGSIPNEASEPILWTHSYGKSPIIYTSLGHVGDFAQAGFNQILYNSINYLLSDH